MSSSFKLGIAWIATVALAFVGGYYMNDGGNGLPQLVDKGTQPVDLGQGAGKTDQTPNFPPEEGNPPDSPPNGKVPFTPPTTPPPRTEKPPENLVEALASANLITRWGSFMDAVRTADEGNIMQVVAAFETLPAGYERNMEMRLLMQAWARFDTPAALAYAKGLDATEGRLAITEVMTSWGEADPDGALSWMQLNVDPKAANRKGYLPGLISGIASRDLERANKLLTSIEDRNARWQASTLLLQRYMEQSPENAMAWANQLPADDPNYRNGILGQVGAAIAKRDPAQCAKWAEKLEPGEGRNRVVSSLIAHWSRRSPSEAAQWAGSLQDTASRVHGMTQVVNFWAFKDPTATAQWLDGYPRTAETDPVVQTFVNRVTSRDPSSAANWANVIVDPNRRDSSVRQVLKTWNRLNASSAEAWRIANAPHIPAGGG
ncbi:MAG: hypothetical protein AAEJ57_06425 [Opitutales bacterium]